jgi:hypothetical protein
MRIANAGTALTNQRPIQRSTQRAFGPREFGRPYVEQFFSNEHYYGIYEREPRDPLIPPASRLADTIVRFFISVAAAVPPPWLTPSDPAETDDGTTRGSSPAARVTQSIRARRGQTGFRNLLLRRFSGRCCVTGSTVGRLLEAAHIELHPGADDHASSDGLLLRSDLHTLFDLGLIAIDPRTHKVRTSPDLQGTEYEKYDLKPLQARPAVVRSLNARGLRKRWVARRWFT